MEPEDPGAIAQWGADKENAAKQQQQQQRPTASSRVAGGAGGGGSFMRPTASSKQRFGAPPGRSGDGLAGTLRPNLNAANVPGPGPGAGARSAPNSPPSRSNGGGNVPAQAGRSGTTVLSDFRARLNVIKRESVMRQSMSVGMGAMNGPGPGPGLGSAAGGAQTVSGGGGGGGSGPAGGRGGVQRMHAAGGRPQLNVAPQPGGSAAQVGGDRESFGGDAFGGVAFGGGGRERDGAGSVQALHQASFEDPAFIDAVEKCLNFRSKVLSSLLNLNPIP